MVVVPVPPFMMRAEESVAAPFLSIASAAVVEVAVAVEVAMKSELEMERKIHKLSAAVLSESKSCGAVEVPNTESPYDAVVVPVRSVPCAARY